MSQYGEFLLLDSDNGPSQPVERLSLGDTSGKDEAWLRDTLLAHPQILPLADIDPSFGQLVPLCAELHCEAGYIDAVFVNKHGKLTVVECKLWRNPQARREVVAQTLDYASTLANWSYSDLQRQVCKATGLDGNVPFQRVAERHPEVEEPQFVDAVTRNLREGRFLLLVAGDGIREDVQKITRLVQHNAALGFAFALVELALYGLEDSRLLLQPRTLAKTHTIERPFIYLSGQSGDDSGTQTNTAASLAADQWKTVDDASHGQSESPKQAEYRQWWTPVLQAALDDPEQQAPALFWPNNIRAPLPWPGTWLTCYRLGDTLGVETSGSKGADQELLNRLAEDIPSIMAELPPGSRHIRNSRTNGMTIACSRKADEFDNEDDKRTWLARTLNAFCNAIRHRAARVAPQP